MTSRFFSMQLKLYSSAVSLFFSLSFRRRRNLSTIFFQKPFIKNYKLFKYRGLRISYFYRMRKTVVFIICFCAFIQFSNAQLGLNKEKFTHADTLRGSLNPNRTWWDVLRYDIDVKPDYESKTIIGKTTISFKSSGDGNKTMQIDLQHPLIIDSIIYHNGKIEFKKIDSNAYNAFLKSVE